ncbi:MAG TPA: hypothetical protein PLS51_12920 [Flavobacterium sp.]|jgi:hypothetical protein|nr:hypothetical protein [Flavobacterium sp.]HPJ11529.1 hypothetical protein [Flavobacterium sp.]
MQRTKFIAVLILAAVILFGIPLYFMIYWDSVTYFVRQDYTGLAQLIFLPLVVLLAGGITYKSIKADRARNDLDWSQYRKQLPNFIIVMVGAYFFAGFMLSSLLLFINVNFGMPESYPINGKVVGKYKHQGGKSHHFELTVHNEIDGKKYVFNTDWHEIDKYNINDPFQKEMKKGLFGFIYSQ